MDLRLFENHQAGASGRPAGEVGGEALTREAVDGEVGHVRREDHPVSGLRAPEVERLEEGVGGRGHGLQCRGCRPAHARPAKCMLLSNRAR